MARRLAHTRFSRRARLWVIFVAAILTSALPACRRTSASSADCERILDRIVELELAERGFRDQELLDRKRREMRDGLAAQLKECQGRHLKSGALACVAKAKSTEEISHQCLR